jgi:PHD/YefM family antitoxin component YafN of YafNO toxin-antitoxin module
MQQVTSIQEIETAINQNGEMVIGKNNKNNVIVMSMEEYRDKMFDKENVRKLLKSEEDIEKGRTRKATEVIKEFRAKYGF